MVEILAGNTLADMVEQAQQRMAAGDYQNSALFYQQALAQLTGSLPRNLEIRRGLWSEHVNGLIKLEKFSLAAAQVKSYIASAKAATDYQAEFELLILLAETLASQDNWAACQQTLNTFMIHLEEQPEYLEQLHHLTPAVTRLWGLIAAEQGNFPQAKLLLLDALESFAAINHLAGQRTIENDLRRLELIEGKAAVVDEILNLKDFQNTSELLLFARALRRDARYETAVRLLAQRLKYEVEPAWRFPLLHELILLYQLLVDTETVQQLLPLLKEAAAQAANPTEAYAAVEQLQAWHDKGFTATQGTGFESQLHTARALIQGGDLQQAEKMLSQLKDEANTPRLAAYWFLVRGELAFAFGLKQIEGQSDDYPQQALSYLKRAADLAQESSLPEVRSQALRLLGRVHARLTHNFDLASEFLTRADRTEELIAHRQETDLARIRYLEALPTQYDELISAAADRVKIATVELIAGVIVAMEAARGATILSGVLPTESARMRDLPSPTDPIACRKWYTQITNQLPSNMAVWLLHDAPDRIHHGIVGPNVIHWVGASINRHQLNEDIARLKRYWDNYLVLENLVEQTPEEMTHLLAKIARTLQLDLVLAHLPKNVTRLAVVAGNALGDIPFAALPLPGEESPKPLITRYALSDLPCLSALLPLARRSATARGDNGLAVHPPASGLTVLSDSNSGRQFEWLKDNEATITALEKLLSIRQFSLVRFDCHGKHQEDALDSWLELAPSAVDNGHLTARRLQNLTLEQCGTLILGACESGMTQRKGRDERLGFVRAGIAAGASAVLASRWVAADPVAIFILDRFQHYLRYWPRDQALQRAQLDIVEGHCSDLAVGDRPLLRPDHPARWACWTLYGDAGLQTRANWLIRLLRRFTMRWNMVWF